MTTMKDVVTQMRKQVSEPISQNLNEVAVSIRGMEPTTPTNSLSNRMLDMSATLEINNESLLEQLGKLNETATMIAEQLGINGLDSLEQQRENSRQAKEDALAQSVLATSRGNVRAQQENSSSIAGDILQALVPGIAGGVAGVGASGMLGRILGLGSGALALGRRGVGLGIRGGIGYSLGDGLGNYIEDNTGSGFLGNAARFGLTGAALGSSFGPLGAAIGGLAGIILAGGIEVAEAFRGVNDRLNSIVTTNEEEARLLLDESQRQMDAGNFNGARDSVFAAARSLRNAMDISGAPSTDVQGLQEAIDRIREEDPETGAILEDQARGVLAANEVFDGADPTEVIARRAVENLLDAVPPGTHPEDLATALDSFVTDQIQQTPVSGIDYDRVYARAQELLSQGLGNQPESEPIDFRPLMRRIDPDPMFMRTLPRESPSLDSLESFIQGAGGGIRRTAVPVLETSSRGSTAVIAPVVNNYDNRVMNGGGASGSRTGGRIVTAADVRYS
jgi:hypothetical protein